MIYNINNRIILFLINNQQKRMNSDPSDSQFDPTWPGSSTGPSGSYVGAGSGEAGSGGPDNRSFDAD